MKLATRLDQIEPFYVMECAKAAAEMARGPLCDPAQGGRRMIYLNIGEPDFGAPPMVQAAAQRCIEAGRTQYTSATGLPELRQALSDWYQQHFGLAITPDRIVITAGASAGLQLVCQALFEAGDEVLMPDPCYPCNRHFVAGTDATPVLLPTGPEQRFQPSSAQIRQAWNEHTRAVLLASPSNPTGTSIEPAELRAIVEAVRERGGLTIVDEIYLGLSYDPRFEASALGLGDDVISVNSFSKYFGMTGWRLGWLVLPPALVAPIEKLAQNFFICPSSIAQHAALACFEPAAMAIYEQRREEFRARRDYIVPALQALGLQVPVPPDGAFYVWMDCSEFCANSWDLAFELMRSAQIALTPGRDFGRQGAERWLRLSFASSMEDLQATVARLAEVLPRYRANPTHTE
ncbi:pyridoxal phosphate-dependent aminotransferase [Paucibacter sp. KBW04]|uniref:pyridoxal phosphate-dependent aminotransferase n=1 Tax=Paucibacter sp. KBW04 TaxID=2153361 RepID=UPI000F58817F|nr:pyridoxal phosphate-dependent aminotransferase [Paucibacter sp. KBW04]RQO55300.1 pyridoxal phosphate-dependent aminotransferase [Paucibacter sp. KBW04]